ncbi:MAG: D-alanyl-D-alanine carboxypeptidase [Gammaproteobacteria bacterium]|nr:D-alanyl-D-alanine carboxypeptidase [Gammaproteobacteria bacterium]
MSNKPSFASFAAVLIILSGLPAFSLGAAAPVPAPPSLNAKGYIMLDHHSGVILAEKNADERLPPASLTKLMTAYVTFSELAQGKLGLDDLVTISEKAWRTPGSRMFIEVGKQVTVEDLLKGMIVQSGNDASVALSEHVAGTEDSFADLMNYYADQLAMANSRFRNSTGLPADDHYSTASDMAILASALIREFPDYYLWYSQKEFTYNDITQHNRNTLLWRDASVDGLKTGHTDAAGYCLVASAKKESMRLITVVMGTPSEKARADSSQALLNYGFRFFETHRLYAAGETIENARVWKADNETVAVGLANDLFVTIPRGSYKNLKAVMDLQGSLTAPVEVQTGVGSVSVSLDEEPLAELPLVTLADVPSGSIFRRMADTVLLWFE